MADLTRIGFFLPPSKPYYRQIVRGVVRYARPNKPWSLSYLTGNDRIATQVERSNIAAVFGAIFSTEVVRELRRVRCPVVNVSNVMASVPFPTVCTDNEAVGRQVAEHFLDRGFRSFCYVGRLGLQYERLREKGFRECLRNEGFRSLRYCEALSWYEFLEKPSDLGKREQDVMTWLRTIRKPVALFAVGDDYALALVDTCLRAGIRVPEEVAVVGVDNSDVVFCEMGWPPISSVELGGDRVGYEAARLMDSILAGHRPPKATILVPPGGVVTRGSSDILAVEDHSVRRALQFIRSSVGSRVRVDDVSRHAGINRRSLELRFRKHLGRSILGEIQSARLQSVKRLLAETDDPMSVIAEKSGFQSPHRMDAVFRKSAGQTPRQFRRETRSGLAGRASA